MWQHSLGRFCIAATVSLCTMITDSAFAQVVIDMPAPKGRAQPSSAAPALKAAEPTEQLTLEPGDVALDRYAGARTYPYDTYSYADRYAGIRQYGYPYQVWWGWGWWGTGFHDHHHHHHGNQFSGFVGRFRGHRH